MVFTPSHVAQEGCGGKCAGRAGVIFVVRGRRGEVKGGGEPGGIEIDRQQHKGHGDRRRGQGEQQEHSAAHCPAQERTRGVQQNRRGYQGDKKFVDGRNGRVQRARAPEQQAGKQHAGREQTEEQAEFLRLQNQFRQPKHAGESQQQAAEKHQSGSHAAPPGRLRMTAAAGQERPARAYAQHTPTSRTGLVSKVDQL